MKTISLNFEDFKCLVRGGVLTDKKSETQIALQDIGFDKMWEAINSAEKGIDIYEKPHKGIVMTINYLEKITEIYAFVSVDEHGEGVIGQTMNIMGRNTFMPFVCADKDRLASMRPHAEAIARETGKTIKLIRLSTREEIEVIK